MYSDVEFDVDSDFAVKHTLKLNNDWGTDVKRQKAAWKQPGEEKDSFAASPKLLFWGVCWS